MLFPPNTTRYNTAFATPLNAEIAVTKSSMNIGNVAFKNDDHYRFFSLP